MGPPTAGTPATSNKPTTTRRTGPARTNAPPSGAGSAPTGMPRENSGEAARQPGMMAGAEDGRAEVRAGAESTGTVGAGPAPPPAHGAYTNNTLPRGPYLQYKYSNVHCGGYKQDNKEPEPEPEPQQPSQPSCGHQPPQLPADDEKKRAARGHWMPAQPPAGPRKDKLGRLPDPHHEQFRQEPPPYQHHPPTGGAHQPGDDDEGVSLDRVTSVKRLTLDQGWALLCQSVQALQDLFFDGMPSINEVYPLITPEKLHITWRGRVEFTVSRVCVDDVEVPDEQYLAPEYWVAFGKTMRCSESDLEKMWIYTLGITLQTTVVPDTTGMDYDEKAAWTPEHRPKLLGRVIRGMWGTDMSKRPNLMLLLDIISNYCQGYHLYRPFRNMLIELIVDVPRKDDQPELFTLEEQKSETDSGRSSGHGELLDVHRQREPLTNMPPMTVIPLENLRDTDRKYLLEPLQSYVPLSSFGMSYTGKMLYRRTMSNEPLLKVEEQNPPIPNAGQQQPAQQPQDNAEEDDDERMDNPPDRQANGAAARRRPNAELLARRRADFRRNTIDVTMVEVKMAEAAAEQRQCVQRVELHRKQQVPSLPHGRNPLEGLVPSKSSTHLARSRAKRCVPSAPLDQSSFNATSMPNIVVPLKTGSLTSQSKGSSEEPEEAAQYQGPEFMRNARQPPKEIDLTDPKTHVLQRRILRVLLLNGTTVNVTVNPTCTLAGQIFEAVLRLENLTENFFLGLCAINGGDFVFLPPDLKIYKVAPQVWINTPKYAVPGMGYLYFMLYMRIKFFLPTLRGVSCMDSRHLLYLQLRKSILERQILCTEDDLIALGGLAMQSEIGNFKDHMKYTEYFSISDYLPEEVYRKKRDLARYLRNAHFHKRGLHQREAEHNFVRYVQELKEYGLHLYSATWGLKDGTSYDVYVAISLGGVALFERRQGTRGGLEQQAGRNGRKSFMRHLYMFFDWLEIENIYFTKQAFCVSVRRGETLGAKGDKALQKYKLQMTGRKGYFAFNLASEHHKFYMKLRNSFISFKTLAKELNIPLDPVASGKAADEDARKKRTVTEILLGHSGTPPEQAEFDAKNIEKIDKPTKRSGLRVRNLKKSMLNDNRLQRLRQRFQLKRSKSTIETGSSSSALNLTVEITNQQNQNKENENPSLGAAAADESDGSPPKAAQAAAGNACGYDPQLVSPEDSPKTTHSMNRNKVKMGTKVFSAQFLNKSFDNLAAASSGAMSGAASFQNLANNSRSSSDFLLHDEDGEPAMLPAKPAPPFPLIESSVDEVLSVKSSMGSVYFMEKIDEQSVGGSAETLLSPKACVIQSSIRSESCQFELPMEDETISDTLLEKFNNISTCGGSANDRILTTVLIVKDAVLPVDEHGNTSQRQFLSRSQESIAFPGKWSLTVPTGAGHYDEFDERFPYATMGGGIRRKNRESSAVGTEPRYTLGISIVQGNDNNVYVKDLVPNGPGARNGVRVGDQIIAVNGKSLLNVPYADSLNILLHTGRTVELVLSQIFQRSQAPPTVGKSNSLYIKNGNRSASATTLLESHLQPPPAYSRLPEEGERIARSFQQQPPPRHYGMEGFGTAEVPGPLRASDHVASGISQRYTKNVADILRNRNRVAMAERSFHPGQQQPQHPAYPGLSPSKSMPDLPKILQAYSKEQAAFEDVPSTTVSTRVGSSVKLPGQQGVGSTSRKYTGPTRYPVTPAKDTFKTTVGPVRTQLSLSNASEDEQVFI